MAKVLVTGGAGFIGSHLVDALLARGDKVVVLDNFATGFRENLAHVMSEITLIEGDLRDRCAVEEAVEGVEYVTHQAALGSVPRSINDPITSNDCNVNGTLNVLVAAKSVGVKRVVVASSSSIYGDSDVSPKHEGLPFNPKSPYALTKVATEEYARIFHAVYGLPTIALRYFNVFGPRQSPQGAYAAVIPLFIQALKEGRAPRINGDGSFSRDFTYVGNVVQANLKAFDAPLEACGKAYNAGAGGQISILEMYNSIQSILGTSIQPEYGEVRAGDVAHSKADISKARAGLGYDPNISFEEGMKLTVASFS